MASSSDALGNARELVEQRLAEINDERGRLERALAELVGNRSNHRGGPRGHKPSRQRQSSSPRKRRSSSTRSDQAVALIEKHPGMSTSDVARHMNINPNYLRRVLSDLEKEGRVTLE